MACPRRWNTKTQAFPRAGMQGTRIPRMNQRREGRTSQKADWSKVLFYLWLVGVCLCNQARWSFCRFPPGRAGDWKYCRQFEDVVSSNWGTIQWMFILSISLRRNTDTVCLSNQVLWWVFEVDDTKSSPSAFHPTVWRAQMPRRRKRRPDSSKMKERKEQLAKTQLFLGEVPGGSPHLVSG